MAWVTSCTTSHTRMCHSRCFHLSGCLQRAFKAQRVSWCRTPASSKTKLPLLFLKQLREVRQHEALSVSVCPYAWSILFPSAGATLLKGCWHRSSSGLVWQDRECTKCLQLFSRLCTEHLLSQVRRQHLPRRQLLLWTGVSFLDPAGHFSLCGSREGDLAFAAQQEGIRQR